MFLYLLLYEYDEHSKCYMLITNFKDKVFNI